MLPDETVFHPGPSAAAPFNKEIKFMKTTSIICTLGAALMTGMGCSGQEQPKVSAEPGKVLIAYYSWGGNTKYAAAQIQKETGGTLFEIKPVKPYPADYRECTVQAKKDIQEGVHPELAAKVEDIGKYDVIFIGSPNWWSTIAPPVATFLSSYDLSGKTVIPFVTHGGGGMARCEEAVRKLCPKSSVLKGGSFSGAGIRTARAALVKWVNDTITINK